MFKLLIVGFTATKTKINFFKCYHLLYKSERKKRVFLLSISSKNKNNVLKYNIYTDTLSMYLIFTIAVHICRFHVFSHF